MQKNKKWPVVYDNFGSKSPRIKCGKPFRTKSGTSIVSGVSSRRSILPLLEARAAIDGGISFRLKSFLNGGGDSSNHRKNIAYFFCVIFRYIPRICGVFFSHPV